MSTATIEAPGIEADPGHELVTSLIRPVDREKAEAIETDRAVHDLFAGALGTDGALVHYRAKLEAAEERTRRHKQSAYGSGSGQLNAQAGWIRELRDRLAAEHRARAAVAYLEGVAASPVWPTLFIPPSPDDCDRQVIRAAVAEGEPCPTLIRKTLAQIEASRERDAAIIVKLNRQIDVAQRAFRDGTHNVDAAAFEASVREHIPELRKLRARWGEASVAIAAIGVYLAQHVAEAVGSPEPIANGLHAKAALAESSRLAADPELKRMAAELAEVTAQIDALSFGGRMLATVKGDELVGRKKDLDRAIAGRRKEIFAALGSPAEAIVKAASEGDPAAIEQIAVAALAEPGCFPVGTADRLLNLQASALCQSPTVVVDAFVSE